MKPTKFFSGMTQNQAIDMLLNMESQINYNTTSQRVPKRMLNAQWLTCSLIFGFDLKEIQKIKCSKLLNYKVN